VNWCDGCEMQCERHREAKQTDSYRLRLRKKKRRVKARDTRMRRWNEKEDILGRSFRMRDRGEDKGLSFRQ